MHGQPARTPLLRHARCLAPPRRSCPPPHLSSEKVTNLEPSLLTSMEWALVLALARVYRSAVVGVGEWGGGAGAVCVFCA